MLLILYDATIPRGLTAKPQSLDDRVRSLRRSLCSAQTLFFINKHSTGGRLSKLGYIQTRDCRANITNEYVGLRLFRGKYDDNILLSEKVQGKLYMAESPSRKLWDLGVCRCREMSGENVQQAGPKWLSPRDEI